jgi:acetate---CoA ligase (ADP-forming)
MHPIAPPLPAVDDVTARQVVLRDGSVAGIRRSTPADAGALGDFFRDLSAQSRYRRFFSAGDPTNALIERLSDSTNPAKSLTLIAQRSFDGALKIVATASYIALKGDEAEVAFAVADRFQGKGFGTALLELLAVTAANEGFRRFRATTLTDNARMIEVFRDSGFEIRSKPEGGCVDVQLSLAASSGCVRAEEERNRLATAASLRPLLEPRAVAIIGASREASSIGRRVLDALMAAG